MRAYPQLALSIMLLSILVLARFRRFPKHRKALALTGLILLVLMLVFNTYLTALPIVVYNNSTLFGLRVGTIPIEDFSYLIVALLLVPTLYEYFYKPSST